ncbi:hypothetical protein E1281_25915 [Actinomadura sp. KC345]|uniref:hypothetical protein n=1 Tax=Actinomadura sp. KC345 TaxID=2530371 RepID=UPI0010539E5F|nr:hypothetical protein [Actinomadura sp. KC345]TDC47640.1 hypothetical protein E1281_25915 [Actinomadura sp. KC345]
MDIRSILDGIVSHALATGHFERVNGHEPKSAPGNGLTAAVWAQSVAPVPAGSGLARTSAVLVFNVRLYTPMIAEPQDAIDPNMLTALDALFAAYSGNFELGGSVRCIDLLGQAGTAMSAQAGYLDQDRKIYRVFTVTLPVIVNDAWEQVA